MGSQSKTIEEQNRVEEQNRTEQNNRRIGQQKPKSKRRVRNLKHCITNLANIPQPKSKLSLTFLSENKFHTTEKKNS